MVEKKAAKTKEAKEKIDKVEIAKKQIEKQFGNVFVDFNEYRDRPENIIQTVLPLDIITHGGIRQGSVILLSGKYSSGKTTLALHMAGKAQQQYGMPVFLDKIEGRLHKSLVESISCIDKDNFRIIESTEDRILFAEDHLQIVTELLQTVKNGFYILDSISMLCPRDEYEKDMDQDTVMKQGKLIAKFLRKACNLVAPTNSIVVCIAQEHSIQARGPYSKKTDISGGMRAKFQNDLHISCRAGTPYKDKSGVRYGHDLIAKIEKMSWGLGMGNEAAIPIRYGHGVDEVRALIQTATQFGVISKGGGWITYNEEKFNGDEAFVEFLTENKDAYDEIYSTVRDMVFE